MCEQRDSYLGKWLTAEEQTQFVSHLATCLDCRQFIHEQEQLDSLLARANATLLPVPADLIEQIDHRLRQVRRRRVVMWTTGLAAAGVLMGALAIWSHPQRGPREGAMHSPMAATPHQQSQPAPDPRSLVAVRFPSSSEVIAVPHKTDNPNVTIIWVYPTITTAPETAPAPTDSF